MNFLELLAAPGALSSVFQPIVDVGDAASCAPRLHALEGLTRGPAGTMVERADDLFAHVRKAGLEPFVDRLCISAALGAAKAFPSSTALALNVHRTTVTTSSDFASALMHILASHDVAPERITLEILEHSQSQSGCGLARALEGLRARGVRIALDDIGSGASDFRMLLDLRPEFLKIDRYVIDGLTVDPWRRAVVECVLELAERVGAGVIVEGVEGEEQLTLLRSLGARLVQGLLFGGPTRAADLRAHSFFRASA